MSETKAAISPIAQSGAATLMLKSIGVEPVPTTPVTFCSSAVPICEDGETSSNWPRMNTDEQDPKNDLGLIRANPCSSMAQRIGNAIVYSRARLATLYR